MSLTHIDQWILIMSTQLIGFSVGGICNRILVAPPSMIWPENLPSAALFNILHSQETTGTHAYGGISRERFFIYVLVGYFLYSQFSSYFLGFEILPVFSLVSLRFLALLPLHSSLLLFMDVLDHSQ
jgi:OPT oligopeptide transporter protein